MPTYEVTFRNGDTTEIEGDLTLGPTVGDRICAITDNSGPDGAWRYVFAAAFEAISHVERVN